MTDDSPSNRQARLGPLDYSRTGHGRPPHPRGRDSLGGLAGRIVVAVLILLVGVNAVAFFVTPVVNPWQKLWMIVTGCILLGVAVMILLGMRRAS
ncbi:MAG TPA: hypothetical protein VEA69_08760 [Tepidisphaeraceae bacterium]|nr:hypothetical protein [Tepidisphaeraceae bacterium]